MLLLLRSLLFTGLMFASVPPYALLVIAARAFGRRTAYRTVLGWVHMIVGLAQVLCGLRYEVEGRENLPAEASVVLFKHSSAYETLVQMLIAPWQTWVLKRELMWVPFFGWALAALGPIAINRSAGNSAVQQVIDQGTAWLERGRWVMVFPEGTRMPPGETRRYGLSGTLLAQATGCPLVPVAHNAGDFWPRRGWRKRAGTVRFCIGPPVDPAGRNPRELNREIQDWVETKVADLRAGAQERDA
jgi:1-acyl-sn-glycerol-3-phosphate acyltransferase